MNSIKKPKVLAKEATKQGYAVAEVGDSINFSVPNSKTRRGRVGKQIAQTLDTACNQATLLNDYRIRKLTPRECWRLQGFPDRAFDKAKYFSLEESEKILQRHPNHKGKRKFKREERVIRMSNAQLYKQAGNSVTVNVIHAIAERLV